MLRQIMKVACCGSGYVGTPTMAVLALNNPSVQFFVYDVNAQLIDKWRQSCPIHQQGLSELLALTRDKNLHFTSDIRKAFSDVDVIYIAVPTPTKDKGEGCGGAYDMSYVESVSRAIGSFYRNMELSKEIIIVEKSTVPILTHRMIKDIISANQQVASNKQKFIVVSNPQFLAQGSSVQNLTNPDRLVFGSSRPDILPLLLSLHKNIPSQKIITTSTISAELSKLVANCFLAQRVSSINSISLLCEKTGGDVLEIEKCSKFLKASVGFGGSCFKKDLLALIYLAESQGLMEVAEYWRQVVKLNQFRKHQFFQIIFNKMQRNLKNKVICVFGLSFKKNTDDLRESSSIPICSKLLIEGAYLQIYDPLANADKLINQFIYQGLWHPQYSDRIQIKPTPVDAASNSHAILILTEWDEFTSYNYEQFYDRMEKPSYVFDGRNILRKLQLEKIGFDFYAIGQKVV